MLLPSTQNSPDNEELSTRKESESPVLTNPALGEWVGNLGASESPGGETQISVEMQMAGPPPPPHLLGF